MELYRAADYVSERILNRSTTKRPSLGPAANVFINKNGNIEDNLKNMRYQSTLIENMNFSSFNNNLNCEALVPCIPPIFITPDADESVQNPISITKNAAISLPNLITFSEDLVQSENSNDDIPLVSLLGKSDFGNHYPVASESSSEMNRESKSIGCAIPNLSELNQSNSQYEKILDNTVSSCQSNDVMIPNMSGLNLSDKQCDPNSKILQPNLSELKQSKHRMDFKPNLNNLNQSIFSSNGNSITENINSEKSVDSPLVSKETSFLDEKIYRTVADSFPVYLPDLSGLLELSDGKSSIEVSTNFESAELSTINSTNSTNTVSNTTVDKDIDNSLVTLNLLLPDSNELTVNTFDSTKSRKCNSPLPNLTLTTHLPHFTFEKLQSSTNNFNEEIFAGFNKEGRLLGELQL